MLPPHHVQTTHPISQQIRHFQICRSVRNWIRGEKQFDIRMRAQIKEAKTPVLMSQNNPAGFMFFIIMLIAAYYLIAAIIGGLITGIVTIGIIGWIIYMLCKKK